MFASSALIEVSLDFCFTLNFLIVVIAKKRAFRSQYSLTSSLLNCLKSQTTTHHQQGREEITRMKQ
jgi:hypothetical protein